MVLSKEAWLARGGVILSVSSLPSRPRRLRRCSLRSQPRLQLRALLLGWLWLASRRDRNHERTFKMAFQVRGDTLADDAGVKSGAQRAFIKRSRAYRCKGISSMISGLLSSTGRCSHS